MHTTTKSGRFIGFKHLKKPLSNQRLTKQPNQTSMTPYDKTYRYYKINDICHLLFILFQKLEKYCLLFPHNFKHYILSLIFKSFSFCSSSSLVPTYVNIFVFFITLTFSFLFPRHRFCSEDPSYGYASPSMVGLKCPTCLSHT